MPPFCNGWGIFNELAERQKCKRVNIKLEMIGNAFTFACFHVHECYEFSLLNYAEGFGRHVSAIWVCVVGP